MTSPNLFEIATSELSQDAFITWLLQCGDIKYKDNPLHSCSHDFIRALLQVDSNYNITKVTAYRQWKSIDVCCEVNDQYFIIIEDKKGTKEHSDQLERYRKTVAEDKDKTSCEIIPVYYKMDEQSNFSIVKKAGYTIFNRMNMLDVLKNYADSNDILSDYYCYINNLDKAINSYKIRQLDNWDWWSWRGFFSELQKHVDGNWDYVPNAAGGFLGFWWHWKDGTLAENNFRFYLQLEQEKLIVKIENYNKDSRSTIRYKFRDILYPIAKEKGIALLNYGRVGTYMGVARLNKDYREVTPNKLIDMDSTIKNLKNMQKLINAVYDKIKEL